MSRVSDLLRNKPQQLLWIRPKATVFDALRKLAEHNIGALVVLDNDMLVGIFSERDYARKVVLAGKASKTTPISEVMTTDIVSVRPDQSVEDCMALMTRERIRHLPVMQAGKCLGVISIGDVVKDVISEQQFTIQQLEQYVRG